jgi:hypothetical protein
MRALSGRDEGEGGHRLIFIKASDLISPAGWFRVLCITLSAGLEGQGHTRCPPVHQRSRAPSWSKAGQHENGSPERHLTMGTPASELLSDRALWGHGGSGGDLRRAVRVLRHLTLPARATSRAEPADPTRRWARRADASWPLVVGHGVASGAEKAAFASLDAFY